MIGGTVATLKIHSHYTSSYTTLRAEFFARQSTPRECSLCRRAFSFFPLNKELNILIYSYFEKGCRKKMCMRQSRKVIWDMINTPLKLSKLLLLLSLGFTNGLSCHSVKFLRRTMNSKPPTISFGIVACTFSRPTTFLEIAVFFRRIFLQPDYRTLINSDL